MKMTKEDLDEIEKFNKEMVAKGYATFNTATGKYRSTKEGRAEMRRQMRQLMES